MEFIIMISRKTVSTVAIAVLMGTGALVATTGAASARMVCNSDGDCWHVENRYNYRYPGTGYNRHNDDWYFHQQWNNDNREHYRDYHEDRGYYKGGVWLRF
jgi:hypothetical protein